MSLPVGPSVLLHVVKGCGGLSLVVVAYMVEKQLSPLPLSLTLNQPEELRKFREILLYQPRDLSPNPQQQQLQQ